MKLQAEMSLCAYIIFITYEIQCISLFLSYLMHQTFLSHRLAVRLYVQGRDCHLNFYRIFPRHDIQRTRTEHQTTKLSIQERIFRPRDFRCQYSVQICHCLENHGRFESGFPDRMSYALHMGHSFHECSVYIIDCTQIMQYVVYAMFQYARYTRMLMPIRGMTHYILSEITV